MRESPDSKKLHVSLLNYKSLADKLDVLLDMTPLTPTGKELIAAVQQHLRGISRHTIAPTELPLGVMTIVVDNLNTLSGKFSDLSIEIRKVFSERFPDSLISESLVDEFLRKLAERYFDNNINRFGHHSKLIFQVTEDMADYRIVLCARTPRAGEINAWMVTPHLSYSFVVMDEDPTSLGLEAKHLVFWEYDLIYKKIHFKKDSHGTETVLYTMYSRCMGVISSFKYAQDFKKPEEFNLPDFSEDIFGPKGLSK